MGVQSRKVPRLIARIAGRQEGVVARRQLLAAGLSSKQIARRLENGELLPEFPGVYRVGHRAPSVKARYVAAVLACGEGAVLSGRAAGHLLGLLRGPAPPPEVTTPTERRVKGIATSRRRLPPDETMERDGVPVTTVPRTLLDLAAHLPPDDLSRACHEAGVKYDTTPSQVADLLARHPNTSGARNLRAVLSGDVKVTLSQLERAFLEVLREEGLPMPETNRPAGGRNVDCRWPDHRLTVELDGYRYHRSRHAWEQDRRREREAHARGDDFRRYTYGDVLEDRRLMLRELHGLLES
jgi:very-short-patch-repair endonuclease